MKKFLISTAVLAVTSTSALAGGWTMGGNGGTGLSSFIMAPISSTNNVNQGALAMPLNSTSVTVLGAGATTSYVTSTTNQTANAMNVFSSNIASTIHY